MGANPPTVVVTGGVVQVGLHPPYENAADGGRGDEGELGHVQGGMAGVSEASGGVANCPKKTG